MQHGNFYHEAFLSLHYDALIHMQDINSFLDTHQSHVDTSETCDHLYIALTNLEHLFGTF